MKKFFAVFAVAVAFAAGLLVASLTHSPVSAQPGVFGPGSEQPKIDTTLLGQFGTPSPLVMGHSVAVVVSPDNKTVWGYSPEVGRWKALRVENAKGEKIVPTVGFHSVSFQLGKRAYAYSGLTGTWDSFRNEALAEGSLAHQAEGLVVANFDGHVYIFSPKVGRWDGIGWKTHP